MPQRCAALGCSNRSGKPANVRFFRFPASTRQATRRKKCVRAIRRVNADGSPWKPTDNTRVCSNHFVSGVPSRFMTHPDYVPSIFKHMVGGCTGSTGTARSTARFERLMRRRASSQTGASSQATPAVAQRTTPSIAASSSATIPQHQYGQGISGHFVGQGTPQNKGESQSDLQDCEPLVGPSTPPAAQGPPSRGAENSMQSGSMICKDTTTVSTMPMDHEKSCQSDDFSLKRIMLLQRQLNAEKKKVQKLEGQLKATEDKRNQWQAHYYELKATTLCLKNMKGTEDMLYYIGLPSLKVYNSILDVVMEKDMLYHIGLPSLKVFNSILDVVMESDPQFAEHVNSRTISASEQMFAVLVRLRTSMATREVARNFSISMASVSRIFSK